MKYPRLAKIKTCKNPNCDIISSGFAGYILSTALDENIYCSLTCEREDKSLGNEVRRAAHVPVSFNKKQ